MEQALVTGDLAGLDPDARLNYYLKVCSSLGLNPLTKPFDYIVLNGKLVLYARKDATDQLRKIHKVSITRLEREQIGDLLVVTASAATPDGRQDSAIGAVNVKGLGGESLANALMKAETKSKRRVTLSLCGLGMTDESEVESIPGAYYPESSMTPPNDVPAALPTREREVDDRDLVRSSDDRIWQCMAARIGGGAKSRIESGHRQSARESGRTADTHSPIEGRHRRASGAAGQRRSSAGGRPGARSRGAS